MGKPVDGDEVSILFCKHSDIDFVKGDITSHICHAINEQHPNEALGAQKIRGTWIIAVRTPLARESLLSANISVNGKELKLYDTNPYDIKATRVEGERVVFKDLPIWESSTLVTDYLSQLPQVGSFSKVHASRVRNHMNNELTTFFNGDRYVFTKIDPKHPLPDRCVIGGYNCRILYQSKKLKCKRCSLFGHKADSNDCPNFVASPPVNYTLFKNGIFSNFHPTPVKSAHGNFASSEHAYQWRACMEHLRDDLAAKVLLAKSPKEAKSIASEVKVHGARGGMMPNST